MPIWGYKSIKVDRDIILNANASDYEKCIREIINKLLKLKREDKIDIKLHITVVPPSSMEYFF